MLARNSRFLTLLGGGAFVTGVALVACEQTPVTPDSQPIAQAPPGACSPWPECKNDDDGDGGSTADSAALDLGDADGDGLGDAMITAVTQVLNLEKDDEDILLLNGGGGGEFPFDADLNFDDTQAAADSMFADGSFEGDECLVDTHGNKTVDPDKVREAIARWTDATLMEAGEVHPKLSVDKNALGTTSADHRISITWTEPDGTGWSLGVGGSDKKNRPADPSTVTVIHGTGINDDPVTVRYTGGTVGMKNPSSNPSFSVLCPMDPNDSVEAAIDRL